MSGGAGQREDGGTLIFVPGLDRPLLPLRPTPLRILHLLTHTPLCICHVQEILNEPQVKISKRLAFLRERGLVVAERDQNWMIYSLPKCRAPELEQNLKCLQDCVQTDPIFKRDLRRLAKVARSSGTLAGARPS
jgi:ArsR family transcriptional regulator